MCIKVHTTFLPSLLPGKSCRSIGELSLQNIAVPFEHQIALSLPDGTLVIKSQQLVTIPSKKIQILFLTHVDHNLLKIENLLYELLFLPKCYQYLHNLISPKSYKMCLTVKLDLY